MGYTPLEKLAIGTALKQRIDEVIGTKNPGNVRAIADEELVQRFERTGEQTIDVMLNSGKVGTFSVMLSKPVPERRRQELDIEDADALRTWAGENGFLKVDMDAVQEHFAMSGEVPAGCKVREAVEPGSPGGTVKGTRLRVDADDVIDALGGYIAPGAAGLLDEAMEDEW